MSKTFWDYQQPDFYRFNSDSLFLVEEVYSRLKEQPPLTILDVGAGCGVIGLELAQRLSETLKSVTLLEPLSEFHRFLKMNSAEIATRLPSLRIYQVQENVQLHPSGQYDLVVSNPPYFLSERGRSSPNILKNQCRMFHSCTPQKFFEGLKKQLSPQGVGFFLGHRDVWGEGEWEVVGMFKEVCLYRFFSVSNCR